MRKWKLNPSYPTNIVNIYWLISSPPPQAPASHSDANPFAWASMEPKGWNLSHARWSGTNSVIPTKMVEVVWYQFYGFKFGSIWFQYSLLIKCSIWRGRPLLWSTGPPWLDMARSASGTYPLASALKALQKLCHRHWASKSNVVDDSNKMNQLTTRSNLKVGHIWS